jgi:spermidine/putrescine transport system ATP-binding protein
MSARVELRHVSKRFGHVQAVSDVSLEVRAGEFLTLLGPSGCGKTTLLRLMAGFEAPDAGSVMIGGADVTRVPPNRRDVNQVFQSYALFPHLSVSDNIAFGLRLQRLPKRAIAERVAEAVALVALRGCEDRKPHQLSGGQQQRVALARALAPRPAVLLLDEPLSALDARLRATMQLELKRLQRQVGTTFIFVTHDQQEALTMSDRIALIREGRVEQCAGAREIYHRPATAFAAEFLGQTNLVGAELIGREGESVRCRVEGGLEWHLPANRWPAGALRATLSIRPEHLQLSRCRIEETNSFAATVQEELFWGDGIRCTIKTDAGMRLNALVRGDGAGGPALPAGARIWAIVRAADIAVLPVTER